MIPKIDQDYGQWKWIEQHPKDKRYRICLEFRYKHDRDYSYIEIVKYYWEMPSTYIHYYYRKQYTKRNLEEAHKFFNLLYISYRDRDNSRTLH